MSLGCPKALVDSERILTELRAEGYEIAPSYEDAGLVVVKTCGFIEATIDESLCAIDQALAENGRRDRDRLPGACAAHIRDASRGPGDHGSATAEDTLRCKDGLRAGDRCRVLVEKAGDYDVWARRAGFVRVV